MSTATLNPPTPFAPGTSPADEWVRWKRRFDIYAAAIALPRKPVPQQRAVFLHVIGDYALDIYFTFAFEETDEGPDLPTILQMFDNHFKPFKHTTFKRNVFFTSDQVSGQSFDEYVTDLKTKSADCEFGEIADSLIRDRIVIGARDKAVKERMLQDPNLTLAKAIDMGRAAERSQAQMKNIAKEDASLNMIAEQNPRNKGKQFYRPRLQPQQKGRIETANKQKTNYVPQKPKNVRRCSRCGTNHPPKNCPAYGMQCRNCKMMNHFATVCRQRKMHMMSEEQDPPDLFLELLTVNSMEKIPLPEPTEWITQVIVEGNPVRLKLDTGSQANVLTKTALKSWETAPDIHLANVTMCSYTGQQVPIIGQCLLKCEVNGRVEVLRFLITDLDAPSVLGLPGCVQLGFVKTVETLSINQRFNEQTAENREAQQIIEQYKDVFTGLGELPGCHKIRLKEGAVPSIQAARRIAQAIREPVQRELERMENMGIIRKITEPTEWVHPMVIVRKPNGKVRICIDPRKLNPWIKREHYQLPAPEEVLSEITTAPYYTVLDAQSAFWQVKLDEESSKLLTMATPYGRYEFLRMPYGVCSAPEVFQQKMHSLYQGIKDTRTFMDDVLTGGSTEKEHNEALVEILEVARKNNLKFERSKLQLSQKKVKFIGHEITPEGINVDPTKVEAIQNIKLPCDKKSLQRFLGTVTYLAKFIPNFSEKTAFLRQFLKKGVEWTWDLTARSHFEELKQAVIEAPVLKHFNPERSITLSVDSSQHGLGAVLLQEDSPIAYASAALTETQKKYSQIEKELLALYYGCKRFHHYLYGRHFNAQTDHKPLLSIIKKQLEEISPRLQRLVIKLQRYDFDLVYVPGKQLLLADLLSRDSIATDNIDTQDIDAQIALMTLNVTATPKRLEQIKASTKADETMQQLKLYIQNGWPDHKKQVPNKIRAFWPFRQELHLWNDMICRGNRLVIPTDQQKQVLRSIHNSHQGIVSTKNVAKEAVYWPGMNSQIEDLVTACHICQEGQRSNMREPLMMHPVPDRPWQKIAIDYFKGEDSQYLIIVDYYSKYPEVLKVGSTTAEQAIPLLKATFARHGIPETLISDGGPPFPSAAFQAFLKEWGIEHTTSSPYYPQSNGLVERMIQTVKALLKKAKKANSDPYLTLLALRTTPWSNLPSPAQLLMGRRLRTMVPISDNQLKPSIVEPNLVKRIQQSRKEQQKKYFDKGCKPLKPLVKGQEVNMKTPMDWKAGTVVELADEPRSYVIQTRDGARYRRNRIHLRPANYNKENKGTSYKEENESPTTKVEKQRPQRKEKPVCTSARCREVKEHRSTRCGRPVRTPERYKETKQ